MTPTQRMAFQTIVYLRIETGRYPTHEMLATALGYKSKSAVSELISRLVERGHLSRTNNGKFAINPDRYQLAEFFKFDDNSATPQSLGVRLIELNSADNKKGPDRQVETLLAV